MEEYQHNHILDFCEHENHTVCIHITGLAVDNDHVYWVNADNGILHKSQKEGKATERLNINFEDVYYLQLIRKTHQLASKTVRFFLYVVYYLLASDSALVLHYACTENLCSHLCLPNWGLSRYTCACPTGIPDQEHCPEG